MTEQLTEPDRSRRAHWNNHLVRHAMMQPDLPALRFQGETITWLELDTRVRALAGALERRGVSFGDRVAIIMGNRPEFIETVLAVNLLGAIAVPMNFRLTGPEAAYILDDSGAHVVMVDEFGKPVVEATGRPDELRVVVVGAPADRFEDYSTLLAEAGGEHPGLDIPESTPALIMYTSGTTGRPKGAILTHLNLQAQAVTIMRAFHYEDRDETNMIASPLFHIGAIGSVIPSLVVGATMVIVPTGAFDAGRTLEILEEEGVTSTFLVPTQWQALCDHPRVSAPDLPRLRVLAWGAAPASDTLLRAMAETFPNAMNIAVFGQTEMSPVTCVLPGSEAIRKLGSVGRPIATVTVRVVDESMHDVEPGEVGEIVYRGPGLMAGYWNNPQATAEAFRGGWFHSGDLVRVDDDGYIYVVDRVKDMVISGGENIYCVEVENVLAGHPALAEVCVVGRPHPKWGETPVAVVVIRQGERAPSLEALRAWAGESLAKFKLPTALVAVAQLPRNASGKVLKGQVCEDLESGTSDDRG